MYIWSWGLDSILAQLSYSGQFSTPDILHSRRQVSLAKWSHSEAAEYSQFPQTALKS